MTTTPVPYGCDWPIDPACFEDEWDEFESDVQNRAISFASATLRRLTGYRVGGCPITVRPCKPACAGLGPAFASWWQTGNTGFYPVNWGGQWMNVCTCGTWDCSCTQVCQLWLPGPVGRLDAVKIDGVNVTSDFRIDDQNLLTFTGSGDCPLPSCQKMVLADTEVGTFSVTYLNAYPVDTTGAYALALLALEFARACTPGKKCRLPSNVTTITRQGVTIEVDAGTFPNGTTGIREVDAFIGLWNPGGLKQPPQVWWPGSGRGRVVGRTP